MYSVPLHLYLIKLVHLCLKRLVHLCLIGSVHLCLSRFIHLCLMRSSVLSGSPLALNGRSRRTHHTVFRSARSRLTGACGERIAQEARLSAGLSLYERLRPARPPECVRLPLFFYSGVDKPVHGQRTSIIFYRRLPSSAHILTHTPTEPVRILL